MNILVTGATGLIGDHLCRFLYNKHQVSILTRNVPKAQQQFRNRVNCLNSLDKIDFNQIDVVINLAGEPIAEKRWTDNQKQLIRQSRFNITQAIVEKIDKAQTPPHTFISGSAIGYYGRQNNDVTIDEKHDKPYDEFSHRLCKQWEDLAMSAHSPSTRVCILRTGIVLSQHGGALKKMLLPFKLGLGGKLANGKQMMSWIHIDDMVHIILFLLKHNEINGVFNATAPTPVSNDNFTQALGIALRRPTFLPMPEKALKLLFGEMSELLIYGQAVIPKRLQQSGYRFRFSSISEAFSNLLVRDS
ncbi:Epimerase family protein [Pseudoalteromonas holothuriae]|uniref:Epimerase family protein n=1 Tax=Pseudoalteromonas holothuriae TaxID=2963714 RepID=A0A9W4QT34_9GAMM|nr:MULTISPECIES: TIGR01777 family oxidoreductase [unclassified Pseudoalteromonas]CAH9051932.1 Epimerase family protein [Pseudoalteromonas sp. CIP111854]CAH9057477.1 Epimerase family protein [Pseudoalteromonas sp. CIP111951]